MLFYNMFINVHYATHCIDSVHLACQYSNLVILEKRFSITWWQQLSEVSFIGETSFHSRSSTVLYSKINCCSLQPLKVLVQLTIIMSMSGMTSLTFGFSGLSSKKESNHYNINNTHTRTFTRTHTKSCNSYYWYFI